MAQQSSFEARSSLAQSTVGMKPCFVDMDSSKAPLEYSSMLMVDPFDTQVAGDTVEAVDSIDVFALKEKSVSHQIILRQRVKGR